MNQSAPTACSAPLTYVLKRLATVIALALVCTVVGAATSPKYPEALDLIHAYSGSGGELDRAMQLAEELSRSHPKSGYAQTLRAEALSTWKLEQNGEPREVFELVVSLAAEALRLDPELAQARVAMARALVRASRYDAADLEITKALEIDGRLSGAMFIRAELLRRTNRAEDAEVWYGKFIDTVQSASRKANGYYWIGKMYQDFAWDRPDQRSALTAKARRAYEQMLVQVPTGAWRNVNFAVFLNGFAADFKAAERYATIALGEMEFPMARYHLAAARYQELWRTSEAGSRTELAASITEVAKLTRVSLDQAISFRSFSSVVVGRLQQLRSRAGEK